MEYLPEKKRTQKTQILKKEQKIHQFRQELVDSNVVLAIVKYLVAMRGQAQQPEDPAAHFMDYVGNQRSTLWDEMEALEDENTRTQEELPSLEAEISRLQSELVDAQRKARIMACYKVTDPEATNALSTKAFVAKISGFAKFELDLKLTGEQFGTLVYNVCTAESNNFDEEKFTEIIESIEKAFNDGTPPYAGDLENETYKAILQAIRDFNTSELASK